MFNTLSLLVWRLTHRIAHALSRLIPAQHKHRVHGALLGLIAADIWRTEIKFTDVCFLLLSVLIELEEVHRG